MMKSYQDIDAKNYDLYQEISAGGVAVKKKDDKYHLVVIEREKMNDYCLPKGHQDEGESLQETVKRELEEETGFKTKPLVYLGVFTYSVKNDEKKRIIMRTVHWFLMEIVGGEAIKPNEEVRAVKVLPIDSDFSFLTYDNDRMFIKRAREALEKLPKKENDGSGKK